MAIHPRKMAIAFGAVVSVTLVGLGMDMIQSALPASANVPHLVPYVQGLDSSLTAVSRLGDIHGVFKTLLRFGVERFEEILLSLRDLNVNSVFLIFDNLGQCFKAIEWAFRFHLAYSLIFFTFALSVSTVAGGAICRMVALQFAQGERPGLFESLRFSTGRFLSFFGAPLTPVFIIICIGSFIAVVGLLGNIAYVGELIVGLSMPLILLAGVLMMLVILGSIGGLNLMFPTIAFENSECFLAVNNSFRYVFSRPWRLGFYTGIATVYGAVNYAVVRFFVFGLLLTCYRFLEVGFFKDNAKLRILWTEPRFENLYYVSPEHRAVWTTSVGAFLVHICVLAVVALLAAFVVSYYFSANTIIYALMRKRVDNIELNEVQSIYEDEEEEA